MVSLPSYRMRVGNPHDLDLHLVAKAAMVAEIVVSFCGFQVGSDLLLDDGGGDGVLC